MVRWLHLLDATHESYKEGESLLIEQNDEWLVSRRYLSEASMAELTTTEPTSTGKELQVA